MAQVFRSMLKEDERPKIGNDDNMLGVRVPPHVRADIFPDLHGQVPPNAGGLSVNKDWRKMLLNHIPTRFNNIVAGARGGDRKAIWTSGSGDFVDGRFSPGLQLRVDGANHGLVEPEIVMDMATYQDYLAATGDSWREITPESVA